MRYAQISPIIALWKWPLAVGLDFILGPWPAIGVSLNSVVMVHPTLKPPIHIFRAECTQKPLWFLLRLRLRKVGEIPGWRN